MAPGHLLALCSALSLVNGVILVVPKRHHIAPPTHFWWDLTIHHHAPIGKVLGSPEKLFGHYDHSWKMGYAKGYTHAWMDGNDARWTAWTWQSRSNKDINGGGFIYNNTGEVTSLAGVSWLLDNRTREITWNCFMEGNATGSLPWKNWQMRDKTEFGFINRENRWGFYTDAQIVLSKHCATGTSVVGKRYKYLNGKEVETSVQEDPFNQVGPLRSKRSPEGFFDKVSRKFKEWFDKVKKMFSGGNDPEGKDGGNKCTGIWQMFLRLLNMLFGRGNPPCTPGVQPGGAPGGQPGGAPGGPPQPEDGGSAEAGEGGGDPPGGAREPPEDAEQLDPSQNEAIRDWE